jgi:DNA-binding response OmpR family regulator
MSLTSSTPRPIHKVLLVEDHEPLLRRWARTCESMGKVALTATRREAAVELALREAPELAFIDLFLEGEDGLGIIADLRAAGSKTYVILVSALMHTQYAVLGMRAGADWCLPKTGSIAETIQQIEEGHHPHQGLPDVLSLTEVEREYLTRVLDANTHRSTPVETDE